jgi:hypothetical protein
VTALASEKAALQAKLETLMAEAKQKAGGGGRSAEEKSEVTQYREMESETDGRRAPVSLFFAIWRG